MGKIHVLGKEIANKIAAGEVVERPASVVKELVENAIDAGAASVEVEIRNGGAKYIRVTDDGSGMSAEDAAAAFLRHATSKIHTDEDLDAIYTLGFRGEALSSIGAVAEVELYTKEHGAEYGSHVSCAGGEITASDDAGAPEGTTFIVQNLFFNTPARQKFLKKDAAEAGYITDIMTRFILAHPEIAFRYKNNGRETLYSSGNGNLMNAVYSVYGKDYAKACINVDYDMDYVHISGVIGKGAVSRPNRTYQSFFVNGRYIKSPVMAKALEEAYKNIVMVGKYPMAVLNIELDPLYVDINVHPTKLEAKFSDEQLIYRTVYFGVKNALYEKMDIPEIRRTADDARLPEESAPDSFKPQPPREQLVLDNIAYEIPKKPPVDYERRQRPKNPFMNSTASERNAENSYERKLPEDAQDIGGLPDLFGDESAEPDTAPVNTEPAAVKEDISDKTRSSGEYTAMPLPLVSDDDMMSLFSESLEAEEVTAEEIPADEQTTGKSSIDQMWENAVSESSSENEKKRIVQLKSAYDNLKKIADTMKGFGVEDPGIDMPEIVSNVRDRDYVIIGQLFSTYIIAERGDEMLMIDQHAAHERLNYEQFMKCREGVVPPQQYVIGFEELSLTESEKVLCRENIGTLEKLGFLLEFDGDAVNLAAVPSGIDSEDAGALIVEILENISDNKTDAVPKKVTELLYSASCKAAIKANHKLTMNDMYTLLDRFFELDNINTCPHGRPVVISMGKKEIEKEFKRIV